MSCFARARVLGEGSRAEVSGFGSRFAILDDLLRDAMKFPWFLPITRTPRFPGGFMEFRSPV
jgi:hypothetical protein